MHYTTLKEYFKFSYKYNKLYLNPSISHLLDNGDIDLRVFDFGHQWNRLMRKNESPWLKIRKQGYDYEFFSEPIVNAFLDSGIIYFHKYNEIVLQSHYINFQFQSMINEVQMSKLFFNQLP